MEVFKSIGTFMTRTRTKHGRLLQSAQKDTDKTQAATAPQIDVDFQDGRENSRIDLAQPVTGTTELLLVLKFFRIQDDFLIAVEVGERFWRIYQLTRVIARYSLTISAK
jgi:hypothetical protein